MNRLPVLWLVLAALSAGCGETFAGAPRFKVNVSGATRESNGVVRVFTWLGCSCSQSGRLTSTSTICEPEVAGTLKFVSGDTVETHDITAPRRLDCSGQDNLEVQSTKPMPGTTTLTLEVTGANIIRAGVDPDKQSKNCVLGAEQQFADCWME